MQESFAGISSQPPLLTEISQTMPEECIDAELNGKKYAAEAEAAAEQCLGNTEHVDPFVTISKGIKQNIPLN